MVQRFFITALLCFVALLSQIEEAKAQSCVIISKGNFMDPATLCAPVDVEWDVLYTGVQDAGATVEIFIDWDDGVTDLIPAVETNPATSEWSVTNAPHTYPAGGNQCRYEPTAFLVVNGNQCTSTAQQQVVTVWDTDDENGGDIAIDPTEYRVCVGHSATVTFTDVSNFNCVPPEENDNPNNGGRWVQWEYGTGSAANRIPGVEVGGPQSYPFAGPVDNQPAPVLGPWSTSSAVFLPNTTTNADIGKVFEVTLNNWNQCNPYPAEPPVTETARIIIVDAPDPDFVAKKFDNSGITTTIFCQGEQVYFRNLTSWPGGSAQGYQWTFYDGPTSGDPVHSTSSSRNPRRTFNSPGFKLVRLVATDGNVAGSCNEIIEKTIEVIAGPIAQIQINTEPLTTDTLTFCEDQFGVNQVIFTDQSLNITANTIHTWEFFDGTGNSIRTEGPSVPGTVLGPFNETYATPGVYDVVLQVQDKNTDCASFDTAVVVITALPQAMFNISTGGTICNNNTVTFDESSQNFTTVPSGFANDTIAVWRWWFDYDGNPLGAPDLVINSGVSGDTSHVYPTPGNFVVRLQVESANGCPGEATQNFTVNPAPIASFGIANQIGCAPLISDLINTSNPQPAGVVIDKYTWTIYDPTGVVLDVVDQPTLDTLQYTFFNSSPEFDAKYAITLTAFDQSGCSFVSLSDTVTVFPSPIISFTSDDYNPFDDNCSPLSATFDVDSIFHANNNVLNYHWSVDDGSGNPPTVTTVSGVQDSFLYNNFFNNGINVKIYTITLSADLNTGGCVIPFTQPVIVQPVPSSAFTALPEENCDFIQFQMETIQKAGILFYDWEFSEVPSNNPLLDDSFALTFQRPAADSVDVTVDVSLVVTNTSNCISDTTRAQIFVPRKPTVDVDLVNTGPVAGCSPFVASFRNGTATYAPGTTFELWITYGASDPIQDVPTSGNLLGNFTYQFTSIGDYRVELRAIEPTNMCPYFDEEFITVYPEAEARFFTPSSGDCAPWDAIFFDDSNDTTIVSREWHVSGPGVSFDQVFTTKTNFFYTFLNNTISPIDYDVTYTVENIYGCRNSKVETVTAFPQLQPSFTVTPKTQTLPSSTVTILDTTPANPWDYRWDFGDGTFSTDPNTSTHTYSTFGVFPISLKVTDPTTGCIGIAYDTVEVIAIPPIVDFDYDTPSGCAPVTVNFTNLSQYASPGTFQWDFGDGIGTSRQQNPTYTYYDPGTYTVSLSASNELDSVVTERKEFIVEVYAEAIANFVVRPEEVFLPDESIRLVNRSKGADSYVWDFGDGQGSTEFEPVHKYEKAGTYDVSLIVTSVNGCTDSLTIGKAVFANDGGKYLIPNTFTPNGDGNNDTFKPETVGVVDYYMEIYDRWGELLYVSDQLNDPGWDGNFKGQPVSQDVYVYKVKLKFISGKSTVRTGDITLLR